MDKIELIKELNRLNSSYSNEELKEFAIEYVTFNAPELSWIKKIHKSFFGTWGALAKICLKNMDEELHKRLKKGLRDLFKYVEEEKEKEKEQSNRPSTSRKEKRINPILFAFDGQVEEVMKGNKLNIDEISLSIINASRQEQTEAIKELEHFEKELTSKDLDLIEAYNIPQKKELLRLVKNVLDKINNFKQALKKKAVILNKKGRAANPVKITEKVKFLLEFNGIKGKHPSAAIGKKKIWAYDTENRRFILYITSSEQGFTFTGTTLKNMDDKKSFSKKIRRPEEFFNRIKNEKLDEIMKSIRAVECKVRSRFNESIMILDVA